MIRLGIIGTGFGCSVHLPAFQRVDGVAVTGLAGRDPEKTRRIAVEHGAVNAFDSWESLISSDGMDAVCIATPPVLHHEIAVATLDQGKHLLCEKPLAMSVTEARDMAGKACSTSVVAMTNFNFRSLPAFRRLKDMLDAGEIGAVQSARAVWRTGSWADPHRPWSWRCDLASGGGIISTLGVHMFDYLAWLFGPIARVRAALQIRIPQRPDGSGKMRRATAEDFCEMVLETRAGLPIEVVVSNVVEDARGHWITVRGLAGTLRAGGDSITDYARDFVIENERSGAVPIPRLPTRNPTEDGRIALMQLAGQSFVDAVRSGDREAVPTFEDGLAAQQVSHAARESGATGTWTEIPPSR